VTSTTTDTQVMLPLLRLLVGLASALAGSGRVRSQAADFAEHHAPALQRLMDDAGSLGARRERFPSMCCGYLGFLRSIGSFGSATCTVAVNQILTPCVPAAPRDC
jgi:hypothetical protein